MRLGWNLDLSLPNLYDSEYYHKIECEKKSIVGAFMEMMQMNGSIWASQKSQVTVLIIYTNKGVVPLNFMILVPFISLF